MKSKEIEICLGSSCHSRGSQKIALILKEYAKENENISLKGCLCKGKCSIGPNVVINTKDYSNVNEYGILDILNETY